MELCFGFYGFSTLTQRRPFKCLLKVIAHSLKWDFHFFSYSPSFPIKMHAADAKTQKIEPDPKKNLTDEIFGGSV